MTTPIRRFLILLAALFVLAATAGSAIAQGASAASTTLPTNQDRASASPPSAGRSTTAAASQSASGQAAPTVDQCPSPRQEKLTDWLTPISTFLAGIISVGLVNFVAEDFRRFRSGSSLAAALAGELKAYMSGAETLRTSLGQLAELAATRGLDPAFFSEVPEVKDRVFESNVQHLGLLGPEIVEDIVFVYGNISAMRVSLTDLVKRIGQLDGDATAARIEATIRSLNTAVDRGPMLIKRLHTRANASFIRLRR